MITKIRGEQPFQVLTNNFSISPSNEGYTLQISADGKNYSNLFTVGAGVTRLVTGVAANSYYRLSGNNSDVSVNWMKVCVTEGGGEGGSGTELEPITEFPADVPEGTVVAYAGSASATGIYQYVDNEWVAAGGGTGSESVIELTQAEYDALTEYADNTTYIITDAEEINMNNYATTAETAAIASDVETLSGDVATKADKANVTANNARLFPKWNTQGVITGTTGSNVYEVEHYINGNGYVIERVGSSSSMPSMWAPLSVGTAGQVLVSNGSGAPVWTSYKFVFLTQTEYDALVTKDATTIYFITGD